MKLHLIAASTLVAALGQPAFADPVDSPAVQKLHQLRAEVDAKKKSLEEERRVEAPEPASPTEPLELTIDETDSPGAIQK
jgi:hypothetical protein